MAQRVGIGVALLFHDRGTRRGEGSVSLPGRTLPPGKTLYPLYRRLGGPQGRSGRVENLTPPGFDPWTVHPVVSRYTDWAIPAHLQAQITWNTTWLRSLGWIMDVKNSCPVLEINECYHIYIHSNQQNILNKFNLTTTFDFVAWKSKAKSGLNTGTIPQTRSPLPRL